jgi:hypothetical protein
MLRMYFMVSCLCLCSWIETGKFTECSRVRDYGVLIVLRVLIGNSHSAGVVPASAMLLYCRLTFGQATKIQDLARGECNCCSCAFFLGSHLGHAAPLSTTNWAAVSHTVGDWPLGYDYDLSDQWREHVGSLREPMPWLDLEPSTPRVAASGRRISSAGRRWKS